MEFLLLRGHTIEGLPAPDDINHHHPLDNRADQNDHAKEQV